MNASRKVDGDKLWDPARRRIDAVLEDDALVDIIAVALARLQLYEQ